MTAYEYIRSVVVFALMLGQPAFWTLISCFPDPRIDWLSPAMLTALGAIFLVCGIVGTQAWLWCQRIYMYPKQ